MKTKIKYILAVLISFLPLSILRVFFYRTLLRYNISYKTSIGFGTIIAVNNADIMDARISRWNKINGAFSLVIEAGVKIGPSNIITAGEWAADNKYKESQYARFCRIKGKSLITSGHYIDAVGGFELGENSWIAGYGSQFWTHGAGVIKRQITIGQNCYIGSAVCFVPGCSIADNNLVALGSVVSKTFPQSYLLIGGNPASIIKENYHWKDQSSQKEPR